MTASRFRDARAVCCLSVADAAKLLRVTERTIQNWESGRVRVPYAPFKLMRILRGYELPGAAWRGYTLRGDTLWSPEGLAFKAADHRWWSLTCRMAHEFRSIMAARQGEKLAASPGLVLSSTSGPPKIETAENQGFPVWPAAALEIRSPGSVLQQVSHEPSKALGTPGGSAREAYGPRAAAALSPQTRLGVAGVLPPPVTLSWRETPLETLYPRPAAFSLEANTHPG